MAGRARRAAPARRDEPEHDVVAGGQPADVLADLLDDAGALVAADDRQLEREVTGQQVLVGVAQAGGGDLHQHLTGLGLVELDLLDAPRRVDLPEDRGLGLHGVYPHVVDGRMSAGSECNHALSQRRDRAARHSGRRGHRSVSCGWPPHEHPRSCARTLGMVAALGTRGRTRGRSRRRPVDVLGRARPPRADRGPSAGQVARPGRRPRRSAGRRRGRAGGGRGPGWRRRCDTATVERAVAGDRREDERAVGGLVGGVDPDPGGRGGRGDRGVDVGATRSP